MTHWFTPNLKDPRRAAALQGSLSFLMNASRCKGAIQERHDMSPGADGIQGESRCGGPVGNAILHSPVHSLGIAGGGRQLRSGAPLSPGQELDVRETNINVRDGRDVLLRRILPKEVIHFVQLRAKFFRNFSEVSP